MGEIAGQLAKCRQLLGLLLKARHLTHPVEQGADAALAHGRDGLQHGVKLQMVEREHPDLTDCVADSAIGLHARERKVPGNLPGAADEESRGTALRAAKVHFASEQQDHGSRRISVAKERDAIVDAALTAVPRQPGKLIRFETLKSTDFLQRLDNEGDALLRDGAS